MTNRKLPYIVGRSRLCSPQTRRFSMLAGQCGNAGPGSILVVDSQQRLNGIFTGRDAVRLLAEGKDAAAALLAKAMRPNPVTITPDNNAIDALRAKSAAGSAAIDE